MSIRKWVSAIVGSAQGTKANAGQQAGEAPAPPPSAAELASPAKGSSLTELESLAKQARSIVITAELKRPSSPPLKLVVRQQTQRWIEGVTSGQGIKTQRRIAQSFTQAMAAAVADIRGQGSFDGEAVTVSSGGSPIRGAKLKELVIAALYETFGQTPPSAEERAAQRTAARGAVRAKQADGKAKRASSSPFWLAGRTA
jgi:hypothetical protein